MSQKFHLDSYKTVRAATLVFRTLWSLILLTSINANRVANPLILRYLAKLLTY